MTRYTELDALLDGKLCCIGFHRVTEGHRELYGVDADGHRGVIVGMIDRDEAVDITLDQVCYDADAEPLDPQPLATLSEALRVQVEAAVDHYLDTIPPDEDDGPDGPDRDDEDD